MTLKNRFSSLPALMVGALLLACGSGDKDTAQPATTGATSNSPSVAAPSAQSAGAERTYAENMGRFLTNATLVQVLKADRQSRNGSWCSQGIVDPSVIRAQRAAQVQTGPDIGIPTPARYRDMDQAFWDALQSLGQQCPVALRERGQVFNQAAYNQQIDNAAKVWTDLSVLVGAQSPGF